MSHTHRHTHTRTPGVQVSIWPPWRPSSPPRPAILKADYFRQITRKTNQKRQLILSSSFRKCPKPPSPPSLPVCTTSCPVSGRGGGGVCVGVGSVIPRSPHTCSLIYTHCPFLPHVAECIGYDRISWGKLQQSFFSKLFTKKLCI